MKKFPAAFQRFYANELSFQYQSQPLYQWDAALLVFRDRPLFGFGPNAHNPAMIPYQRIVSDAHGGQDEGLRSGSSVHNVTLRVFFNT